jgi:hypothetical protein
MIRFHAVIETPGDAPNSWWILLLPPDANTQLGKVRRVRGTINGVPFAGSLMPRGNGVRALNPRKETIRAAGVKIGDRVEVALEADPDADTIVVPDELQRALAKRPAVAKTFAALSVSHRREYVEWIAGAKKSETREARAEKSLEMIAAKLRPSA